MTGLLLLLAAAPAASLRVTSVSKTPDGYVWPETRGRSGSYSTSPYTAPRNLSTSFAWKWENGGPIGKYSTGAHSGLVIDDEKRIYLSSTDGVRKFSPDGELLWTTKMVTWRIPALYKGVVYVSDNNGTMCALSMKTGRTIWSKRFTPALGTDISGVGVHNGIVVTESHGEPGGGAYAVIGMDAANGDTLWEFPVEFQLWNFMPMFTGQDTFVFQDKRGGAYHHNLKTGQRVWKTGYDARPSSDFTDGLAMLADGVVYTVHSDGACCRANQPANLRAYDASTGTELWKRDFPHPANSQAAVGHLGRGSGVSDRLSVVMPIGAQPVGILDDYKSSIVALDAKTGEKEWEFAFPDYIDILVAGDRTRHEHGTLCLPNPYGSPSIDARGTVYTGHFNGYIYAIRDDNGDGVIQDSEVSKFDTGAGFSHGGAALAPGMLAIPSCDGLYVFKE